VYRLFAAPSADALSSADGSLSERESVSTYGFPMPESLLDGANLAIERVQDLPHLVVLVFVIISVSQVADKPQYAKRRRHTTFR
jgi:hypothetical protein